MTKINNVWKTKMEKVWEIEMERGEVHGESTRVNRRGMSDDGRVQKMKGESSTH